MRDSHKSRISPEIPHPKGPFELLLHCKAPFVAVVYYHALGAFTLGVRDTSVMSPNINT